VAIDDPVRVQGLGWLVEPTASGTAFDHSGFFVGYASQVILVPERGMVISVLGNSAAAWDVREAVHRELRSLLQAPTAGGYGPAPDVTPGTYDYPEVDHLTVVATETGLILRIVEHDGRVEESAVLAVDGGGYEVASGEFAGCHLAAIAPGSRLIRLAERLGRKRDG
jgi:hypothetical protein